MYRRGIAVLLAGMCVSMAVGCGSCETIEGSGNIDERELEVSGFTELNTCCGWRVIITQGEDEGVRVRGDDNIIAEIVADKSGESLDIDYADRSNTYLPTQPVRVEVTVAELDSYAGSGGSDVTMNPFEAGDMKLLLSGGSKFEGRNLQVDALDVNCSGGGSVGISDGSFPSQDVILSGGSVYRASAVETQTGNFNLSGGSEATVWVSDTLDVMASGGSKFKYYGDASVSRTTSGGSSIERLGDSP